MMEDGLRSDGAEEDRAQRPWRRETTFLSQSVGEVAAALEVTAEVAAAAARGEASCIVTVVVVVDLLVEDRARGFLVKLPREASRSLECFSWRSARSALSLSLIGATVGLWAYL
jgi:hypothetical protein